MEEKQLTSRELEEQANALLAEADFEEINLPKKAKKAAAAKKANEDTAQAEKPAEKYPPLDEKLVASLPAAALLQGSEKLMEIFAKGKAKGKLNSSDLMETIDEMNLESEQLDQIYDSLETLGIDIGTAEAIDSSIDDVEPPMEDDHSRRFLSFRKYDKGQKSRCHSSQDHYHNRYDLLCYCHSHSLSLLSGYIYPNCHA